MVAVKENKKNSIIKKLALFASVATVSLSLSGCGSWKDVLANLDNTETAINTIYKRNSDFIDMLNQQGMLSDYEADLYKTTLKRKVATINATMGNGTEQDKISSGEQSAVLDAITPETKKWFDAFDNYAYTHEDGTVYYNGLNIGVGNEGVTTTTTWWKDPPEKGICDSSDTYGPGHFYMKTDCEDKDANGNQEHSYKLKKVTTGKFNNVKAGMNSFSCLGKAYTLYDSTQTAALKDALTRPIYIVTKFDANHTAEQFQAVLSILGKNKVEAKRMVEDLGIGDTKVKNKALKDYAEKSENLSETEIKNLENFLMEYCEPCKYADGSQVTFLKCETYSSGKRYTDDTKKVPYIFADTLPAANAAVGTAASGDELEALNKLGTDLVVTSDNKISVNVRIMEFNPELLESLKDQDRLSDDNKTRGKFYKTTKSDTLAAIRLDYPMYKIDSIKTENVTSEDWKATISDTGLFMDLADGSVYDDQHYILKYNNQQLYTKESVLFWDYNYVDADDPNSTKITMKDVDTGKEFNVHPLVLRDYVELYYVRDGDNDIVDGTPGESPEYWIPVGRRLRVTKLKGGKDDIKKFARSLSFDGTMPESVNYISLDKITDRTSGYGFYEGVSERLGLGVDNSDEINSAINATRTEDSRLLSATGGTYSTENFGLTQKEAMFNQIFPTICMGEEQKMGDDGVRYSAVALAQIDHDKVYKKQAGGTYAAPTVYGMTLSTPLTSANITGGDWIGNTENESEGVQKWNSWLSDNNFNYQVPLRKLLEMLGIAIDELNDGESGIIFDADVLKDLTEKYNNDEIATTQRVIRTISVIFGFVIQAYALLLLGAWVFDTNIYAGPQILKKMSAGKWEAVKDKSDYASDTGEIHYMDLRDMIFMLMAFTTVGVLLEFFDPIDIMNILKERILPLLDTLKSMIIGG